MTLPTIMIFLHFLLLRPAAADSGDDFSNNLFTDLSPYGITYPIDQPINFFIKNVLANIIDLLLALFGERVTKQFLYQAMGLSDCIILAMAPLGIITIIVAAIRVSGPPWLKALIGRATEGRAAAELELMSSTSNQVCELWNGTDVVRCAGSASVWEFICLLPSQGVPENPVVKIMSMKDAVENSYIATSSETKNNDRSMTPSTSETNNSDQRNLRTVLSWLLNHKQEVHAESGNMQTGCVQTSSEQTSDTNISDVPANEVIIIKNTEQDAPNISHNRYKNTGRNELHLAACFGILLQIGYILYCGIITQFSSIAAKFQKDGSRGDSYAFPLTIIGTLVLNIGMLICCHVVETSTEETMFRPTKSWRARMVWLQREKTVGDQEFKSFALFTGEDQPIIITSSRKDESETSDKVHKRSSNSNSNNNALKRQVTEKNRLELMTVIGSMISIIGFFAQFIGIRGMHWSASVASLIAILIMAAVRAWVRRGLTKHMHSEHLRPGFELDWFANTLNNIGEAPWYKKRHSSERERNAPTSQEFKLGETQKCTKRRQELASLIGSQGPASKEAMAVKLAIEATMNLLYKTPGIKEFSWFYNVHGSSTKGQEHQFSITKQDDGKWKANTEEIEAALSLRLFYIKYQEKTAEPPAGNTYSSSIYGKQKHMKEEMGISILGPNTMRLFRNLDWWVPPDGPRIWKGRAEYIPAEDSNEPGAIRCIVTGPTEFEVHESRVVWLDPRMSYSTESSSERMTMLEEDNNDNDSHPIVAVRESEVAAGSHSRLSASHHHDPQLGERNFRIPEEESEPSTYLKESEADNLLLIIKSLDLSENLYANDMFSKFIWAVVNSLEHPIRDNTDIPTSQVVLNNEDSWRRLTLYNDDISRLAMAIQSTGLCNIHEAYISVVLPLCMQQKLPKVDSIIELVRSQTSELEARHSWKDAGEIYLQLSHHLDTFGAKSYTYIRAIAVLVSFRNALQRANSDSELAGRLTGNINKTLEQNINLLYEFQDVDFNLDFGSKYQSLFRLAERYKKLDEDCLVQGEHEAKAKDVFDRTPLHYCAVFIHRPEHKSESEDGIQSVEGKDISLLYLQHTRQLIDNGTDINGRDIRGWTPLHYACRTGKASIRVAQLLLEKGALVDVRGRDGTAPIHCAAIEGHFEMVQLLLEFGAQIDIIDGSGSTALHAAALKGSADVFQFLCSRSRITRDKQGRTALHIACEKGHDEIAESLLEAGVDINAVNIRGETPLLDAVRNQRESTVKLLTARNAMLATALQVAVRTGTKATIFEHLLLKEGKEVNTGTGTPEGTPLHWASDGIDNNPMIKHLIDLGAKIDAIDRVRRTPLHRAVLNNKSTNIQLLVNMGANKEARDRYGRTPLQLAAARSHSDPTERQECIRLLIELGALVNASDDRGRTALHAIAVDEALADLIPELLKAGAVIEEVDEDGCTPLHQAVLYRCSKAIKSLLEHEANTEAVNNKGKTPRMIEPDWWRENIPPSIE